MTVYQTIFALAAIFALIGIHKVISRLFCLLDDHLERFQSKLDVLLVAQTEHNDKIDAILRKLF